MSEFQIGLLGIGMMVVVAVMAFNKWQEIRYRRDTEMSLKSDHADLLLEPIMHAEDPALEEEPAQRGADAPDAVAEADAPGVSAQGGRGARSRTQPTRLSTAIDLMAALEAPSGLSVEDLATSGLDSEVAARISCEAL